MKPIVRRILKKSIIGMGTNYGQQVTIQNFEAEKSERASGEYYKKFSQNANLGFDMINLPLIIGGIITVICSVYCVR